MVPLYDAFFICFVDGVFRENICLCVSKVIHIFVPNNTPKEKLTPDNQRDNQEVSQTNSTLAGNRTLI